MSPSAVDPLLLPQHVLVKLHAGKTVRFSASDIAAMTGFHPFRNLSQLIYQKVYQGRTGSQLLALDAQALGIGLVADEEQIWKSLAAQAGSGTLKALEKALTADQKTTKTVQQAQALKQEVVKQAKASKKLNETEIKILQEGARHAVNTRFGTCHEENALDQCEARFGWEICQRNAEIREWAFRKNENTVEPIGEAKACWTMASVNIDKSVEETTISNAVSIRSNNCGSKKGGTKRQKLVAAIDIDAIVDLTNTIEDDEAEAFSDSKKNIPPDTTNAVSSESASSLNSQKNEEDVSTRAPASIPVSAEDATISTANAKKEEACQQVIVPETSPAGANPVDHEMTDEPFPFLTIRGSVDGIREELTPNDNNGHGATAGDDDDDSWVMKRIVVELKHRMNRIYHSPPLYEQIQAVTYCFMYNVDNADIVQVIRQDGEDEEQTANGEESPKAKGGGLENKDSNAGGVQNENSSGNEKGSKSAVTSHGEIVSVTKDNVNNTEREEEDKGAAALVVVGSGSAIEPIPASTSGDSTLPSSDAKEATEESQQNNASNCTKGSRKRQPRRKKPLSMQTDRVSLDDPMFQHRQNWHDVILPRLCSFAQAIYAIRKDDSKRYRLLTACSDPLGQLEQDAWAMLHEECHWLKNCDTAFNRV